MSIHRKRIILTNGISVRTISDGINHDSSDLDEKMSISKLSEYAEYQASTFRSALKEDGTRKSEKRKNLKNCKNNQKSPVKMGIFEMNDSIFQHNLAEIQKLPQFMKFYSGMDY